MRTLAVAVLLLATACGPKTVAEAEARRDVDWLAANPSGESIAALGRLADGVPTAMAALEARAATDVNVHIAAFTAVARGAAWGTTLLKASLRDPERAELAARALPRKDPRLVPFLPELEGAVVRLAASRRGSPVASIVASLGPPAHAAVERRLVDAKTRGLMCEGIGLPEASADARATLLAVPADARDHVACVAAVVELAVNDDAVVAWLGGTGEVGMLGVAARSTLPCPRLASMWRKALTERGAEAHAAMTVPLARSIARCARALDPILGGLLTKAPGARSTIIQAIDPGGPEVAELKATCDALQNGHARGESPLVRMRAAETLKRGCPLAR